MRDSDMFLMIAVRLIIRLQNVILSREFSKKTFYLLNMYAYSIITHIWVQLVIDVGWKEDVASSCDDL